MRPSILILLLTLALLGCSTNPSSVENVMAIREGMTTNEVLAVMGPPSKVQEFPAQDLVQWTWSSRSLMTKRNGSIVISDGVVFQVPERNSRSTSEVKTDGAKQASALQEKIRHRDMNRKVLRSSISVEEQNASARAIDEELRQIAAKRSEEARAARKAYVNARPDMPASHREAIIEQSILTGMTREDVLTAWGRPESKNVTQGKGWRHEQWVYPGNRYLYFKNGRLDAMSFSE